MKGKKCANNNQVKSEDGEKGNDASDAEAVGQVKQKDVHGQQAIYPWLSEGVNFGGAFFSTRVRLGARQRKREEGSQEKRRE